MAKYIVFDYEFDASERTIVLDGVYSRKRFLLITNQNSNEIIFSFSDPSKGVTDVSYDYDNYTTTITLVYDTTSMSDTDQLQIFVEADSQNFKPDETFVDPVSKFRVSQPENLIDTDFEYGLQSTKWETLELTSNIPTFFSRNGDLETELVSINTQSGSDIITVTTAQDHGFQRGSPIIMVGTSTSTADGGFVVASTPSSTVFTYKAKAVQSSTTSIKETFTQLFAGSVYSATEFKLANVGAITTNSSSPSTLTVNTQFPTKFTNGTSMTLSNTFAKSDISFSTDDVEPNNAFTINASYVNNTATNETDPFIIGGVNPFRFIPRLNTIYFEEGSLTVNTSLNTITFPEPHGFSNLDPVVYIGAAGLNTPIGGLQYFRGYWVIVVDSTTIHLHTQRTTSTTRRANLTSSGSSGGIVKSAFARCYSVASTNSTTDLLSYYEIHDFSQTDQAFNRAFICQAGIFSNPVNFSVTTSPYLRTDIYDYYTIYNTTSSTRISQTATGSFQQLTTDGNDFMVLPILEEDAPLGATLYFANHGLTNPTPASLSASVGTLPTLRLSTATTGSVSPTDVIAVPVGTNRISFQSSTGVDLYFADGGSTNLEYDLTATGQLEDADTITIANNTLQDGDAIIYDENGGTTIGGLTDGTTYYVARKNGDRFNLSTTPNAVVSSITILQTSTFVDTTNDDIQGVTHGFSTGDCVEYSSSQPIGGLQSGNLYFVRSLSATNFQLHPTSTDATANTNKVNLTSSPGGSGIFTKFNIVDISSAPSGETQKLIADFIGAADGIYSVSSTSENQLSFTLPANVQILPRSFTKESQTVFTPELDGFYSVDHGFATGEAAVVTLTGTTGVSGITSGNTYYIISKSKDFIQLANSLSDAQNGIAIALTDTASASARTGTIDIAISSVTGKFSGSGTVSYDASSNFITAEGTNFTSYFNSGDTFQINIPPTINSTVITAVNTTTDFFTAAGHGLSDGNTVTFSGTAAPTGISFGTVYFVRTTGLGTPADQFQVFYTEADANAGTNVIQLVNIGTSVSVNHIEDGGEIVERVIDYVNSDTQITFTEALPATSQTGVNYFLNTQLLLRSDGFALHRPYDGGVELIPSSNPDSRMIRQTRKYFRYQSGKGIQVSFAVNFSPSSQIDTFTRSGNVGTITTRFPHRLTSGLTIVTSGSTNTNQDTIGTKTYNVTVATVGGSPVFAINGLDLSSPITLYEGRTYRFDQSDASNATYQLLFSTTEDGSNNGGVEYTTGVTKNGTAGNAGAYTEITVASGAPTLYAYVNGTAGVGFTANTPTDPQNGIANLWNGELRVLSVISDTSFTVELEGTPSDISALGVVEYYVKSWSRSALRCGVFDDQNGIFFEFDGQDMYVCRRSSIRQISGFANVSFRSAEVNGVNTKFASQVNIGDNIVIKGQSHTVIKIDSDTKMFISPSYRGVTADKVIITKTETTRIRQDEWNLDKCDGTGYTGFKLDKYKIQMAYIDYAWYGAGKVRFGFKDQNGDVKYVHQFIHGNFFTEAYMRSGNLPARYEIENLGAPTYVPALAHWGTSLIMDGRFDDDRAYVFNASSSNITLTGETSLTAQGKIDFTGNYVQRISGTFATLGPAILLDSANPALNAVSPATPISGADLAANTVAANPISSLASPFQPYMPQILTREGFDRNTEEVRTLLLLDKAPTGTAVSSSTYTIGTSGRAVTATIPLISIRLAPSVDTSAPGRLGEREIINRMQLILDQVQILTTHTAEIQLILNAQLSTNIWQRVNNPSLSQLLLHTNQDTVRGGASIYNFRAAGDTGTSNRSQQLTTQLLGEVATLGNSILGGDNTYPDGPDVLTVAANLTEDPSTVSSTNPFIITGRISWSESQA